MQPLVFAATPCRLTSPLGPSESLGEGAVWQLIPHLNLDAQRLMMLVTAVVACFQDGKKNRHLPALNSPLRLAIWNFIRDYPAEFSALSGAQKGELSRECMHACTQGREGHKALVALSA